MADLESYAAWFIGLADEAEIDAFVVTRSHDGQLVVRYTDLQVAQRILKRVLLEWERPDGSTLQ